MSVAWLVLALTTVTGIATCVPGVESCPKVGSDRSVLLQHQVSKDAVLKEDIATMIEQEATNDADAPVLIEKKTAAMTEQATDDADASHLVEQNAVTDDGGVEPKDLHALLSLFGVEAESINEAQAVEELDKSKDGKLSEKRRYDWCGQLLGICTMISGKACPGDWSDNCRHYLCNDYDYDSAYKRAGLQTAIDWVKQKNKKCGMYLFDAGWRPRLPYWRVGCQALIRDLDGITCG